MGLDRLVVGYAFRISAFCDSNDLLRHLKLLLFHYLEILDDVYGSIRSDECQLAQLAVLEELVSDLDDSLLSVNLAREVDADGDLAFNSLEIKDFMG